MHKTVYINIDEEIIGIISKIRKETATEIFLVVPKNSLLTQGIINLKLLKKEVAKMNKKIILVTSDQHSKRIIKRVGLETKNKSVQDFIENEDLNTQTKNELEIEKPFKSTSSQVPKKREIGSSDFYNSASEKIPGTSSLEENKESLESRFELSLEPEAENKKIKVITPNTFGKEHLENHNIRKEIQKKQKFISKTPPEFRINPNFDQNSKPKSKTIIDDFYKADITSKDSYLEKKPTKKIKHKISSGKKIKIGLFIVILLLLSFLGYWIISNWPKMQVELFLKEKVLNTNLDITVCGEKITTDDCLNGKYQEITIAVSDQYDSSGEEFSNDKGRARGLVKIYNNYSSSSQPLVATTRILSKKGKLFRLTKNVVVPGIIDDKPGVVEAQVIADETGQSYNIEASEFTIEGFKGNEKYTKFKVVSENPMIGGANDIENKKVKVVTKKDIDLAREKTIELFNKNLEKNIKERLDANETFVLTSVEKEIISSDSSYAPGDIINKFDYTVQEKIKLITFSNDEFETIIKNSFDDKNLNEFKIDKISKINFEKDIINHELKKLELSITASAIYWPVLKEVELKENIKDKNSNEVKVFLTNLANIRKAVILYTPSWLSSLPIKQKNISIKISQ